MHYIPIFSALQWNSRVANLTQVQTNVIQSGILQCLWPGFDHFSCRAILLVCAGNLLDDHVGAARAYYVGICTTRTVLRRSLETTQLFIGNAERMENRYASKRERGLHQKLVQILDTAHLQLVMLFECQTRYGAMCH